MMEERMKELRETSGNITYSDTLTTFLYLLLRDHLPAGKVEGLVWEVVNDPIEINFTNGWLAEYASNLATQISDARVTNLKKALELAFTQEEEKRLKARKEELSMAKAQREGKVSDSFSDDEFAKLEQKLVQAAKEGKATKVEEGLDPRSDTEVAKEAVQQLVSRGIISEEEAKDLEEDIDSAVVSEAPEEVKSDNKNKMSAEEAKEMVEQAVELDGAVEELKKETSSEVAAKQLFKRAEQGEEEVSEFLRSGEGELKIIKNGEVVDNTEWYKEHVTLSPADQKELDEVAAKDDKWQNTEEELKKIDEETKPEEE